MFSRTVIEANVAVTWNVRPTPSRAIVCGESPINARPAKAALPRSGASWPSRTLNKVVLPAPLGPMTATRSPAATLEAHAGERLHAAKGLGDVAHRKQRDRSVRLRAHCRRAVPQRCADAGAPASAPTMPCGKSSTSSQDRRAEHRAPVFGVARQRVLQPGQHGRAGDRSRTSVCSPPSSTITSASTERGIDKRFGRDAAFGERVKRSGQSCGEAREHECRPSARRARRCRSRRRAAASRAPRAARNRTARIRSATTARSRRRRSPASASSRRCATTTTAAGQTPTRPLLPPVTASHW